MAIQRFPADLLTDLLGEYVATLSRIGLLVLLASMTLPVASRAQDEAQGAQDEAQESWRDADDPAGELAREALEANCKLGHAYKTRVLPNRFVTDLVGTVYDRPDTLPREGEKINVVVIGPGDLLPFVSVVRTSPTRDADDVHLIGDDLDPQSPGPFFVPKCGYRVFQLADFTAPEGTLELRVAAGTLPLDTTGEIRFAVRRSFSGAISFGAFRSSLPDKQWQGVAAGADTTKVDSVLAVSGDDERMLFALTFTYYLNGPITRDSWGLGPFIALPVDDGLGEAIVGLSVSLKSGLLLMHGGGHIGKERELVHPTGVRPRKPINGIEILTEEKWQVGWTVGITIDAQAAARAFGKVFESLVN